MTFDAPLEDRRSSISKQEEGLETRVSTPPRNVSFVVGMNLHHHSSSQSSRSQNGDIVFLRRTTVYGTVPHWNSLLQFNSIQFSTTIGIVAVEEFSC